MQKKFIVEMRGAGKRAIVAEYVRSDTDWIELKDEQHKVVFLANARDVVSVTTMAVNSEARAVLITRGDHEVAFFGAAIEELIVTANADLSTLAIEPDPESSNDERAAFLVTYRTK